MKRDDRHTKVMEEFVVSYREDQEEFQSKMKSSTTGCLSTFGLLSKMEGVLQGTQVGEHYLEGNRKRL